ncbi:MAG: DUF6077 domain-containing protein [Candidatus Binatia bacterium]
MSPIIITGRGPQAFCDAFFLCFAAWTLLANACYFLGGSFKLLAFSGPVVCLSIVAVMVYDLRRTPRSAAEGNSATKERSFVLLFIVISIALTLCLNRPDADDQYYLGLSILALDHPELPIREIPAGRGFRTGYALTSHELLKSAVTYLTHVPILHAYYLVVPAFLSIFVALIHWRLLRLLIGERWIIGFWFFLVVMLAWGDVHRTHANFGFVRLFQGKAALVSIIVPALIFYFLKYCETREAKYLVLVFSALIAGIGFSPTGIVIGLLTSVALIVANAERIATNFRDVAIWISILLLPLIAGLLMMLYFRHASRGVWTAAGLAQTTTNYDMFVFVMGAGFRGVFALVCFAVSPLLVENRAVRRPYARFVIACLILLFIPWSSQVIAQSTFMTASWRWLWMIPFPAAMAVVVGGASRIRRGLLVVAVLFLGYVVSPDPYVISEENHTRLAMPDFKLDDPNRIFLFYYGKTAEIRDGRVSFAESSRRF